MTWEEAFKQVLDEINWKKLILVESESKIENGECVVEISADPYPALLVLYLLRTNLIIARGIRDACLGC
jgi:hypothetical protein